MRSDPADYQLVAPTTLQAVIKLLADEPGGWLPIAGGTDVMVQYAAGKLPARKLVSIWHLPELRRIEVLPDEIRIGAGCTYTDLREHDVVDGEFSLLASAASWIIWPLLLRTYRLSSASALIDSELEEVSTTRYWLMSE